MLKKCNDTFKCDDLKCVHNNIYIYLADAFILSDLECIQAIQFLSVCVFPGNWTQNLLRC